MNDEGYCFQDVEGFLWLTDERTGICECRVAFATEKDKVDAIIQMQGGGPKVQRSAFKNKNKSLTLKKVILV